MPMEVIQIDVAIGAFMKSVVRWMVAALVVGTVGCGTSPIRVSGRVLNTPQGAKLDPTHANHNRSLVKKGWETMSEEGPCGEARADTHYFVEQGQVGLTCRTVLDDGVCKVTATISDPHGNCSGEAGPSEKAASIPGASPCIRSLTCRLQLDPSSSR
jgi:hypothetical protein